MKQIYQIMLYIKIKYAILLSLNIKNQLLKLKQAPQYQFMHKKQFLVFFRCKYHFFLAPISLKRMISLKKTAFGSESKKTIFQTDLKSQAPIIINAIQQKTISPKIIHVSSGTDIKIVQNNGQISNEKRAFIFTERNHRTASVPRIPLQEKRADSPENISPLKLDFTDRREQIISSEHSPRKHNGRKYKISSAPAGSPINKNIEHKSLFPNVDKPFQSEIDHWRDINTRINTILDKKLVWIPESELIARGLGQIRTRVSAREETARLKMTLPKYINKKSRVKLYNMRVNSKFGRKDSV